MGQQQDLTIWKIHRQILISDVTLSREANGPRRKWAQSFFGVYCWPGPMLQPHVSPSLTTRANRKSNIPQMEVGPTQKLAYPKKPPATLILHSILKASPGRGRWQGNFLLPFEPLHGLCKALPGTKMPTWIQLHKGWRSKRSMRGFSASSSYWMTVTAVDDQASLLHKLLDDAQRLHDANTISRNFQKTSEAENQIYYYLEIKKKRQNFEREPRWKHLRERDALLPLRACNPSQEDDLTLQGQLRKGRREFHPLRHLPKVSATAKDSCHSPAFTHCLPA